METIHQTHLFNCQRYACIYGYEFNGLRKEVFPIVPWGIVLLCLAVAKLTGEAYSNLANHHLY